MRWGFFFFFYLSRCYSSVLFTLCSFRKVPIVLLEYCILDHSQPCCHVAEIYVYTVPKGVAKLAPCVCISVASFVMLYGPNQACISGWGHYVLWLFVSLNSCQQLESVLVQSAAITWTHHFLCYLDESFKSQPTCWVCRAPLVSIQWSNAAEWDSNHMVTFKHCREETNKWHLSQTGC